MFIAAIILALIGVVLLAVGFVKKFETYRGDRTTAPNTGLKLGGAGGVLLGIILFVTTLFFTQSAGEASVVTDWTGNISSGAVVGTGLLNKARWEDTTSYNIRNQQVVYVGNSADNPDNTGGKANGPQITVQDKDGVTSNIDIAVRYSIRPDSVVSIFKQFKTEDNFKTSFIEQDVRSAVRLAPNKFDTIDLITKRGAVETAIQQDLADRWAKDGVTVDSVSLQEIRVPDSVTKSYAAAQQAQIDVTTQQNKLAAAKVQAQQQVVQAQAKADANKLLQTSLTESVLKQNYLDTLKSLGASGNLVVVPNGFNGILNLK